jgi:RNA polymerase sigma factor (sigma-70 family)
MPNSAIVSDEILVRELASGRQDSFGRLYRRYASLILNMAARSLDRGAAEEILQDVFMTVWRRAAVFTPERGTFRAWVLQMAHFRILNELRRRHRRPQLQPDPDGALLAGLADAGPEPEDAVVRRSLSPLVQSACRGLPAPQRQAVDRVFFRNLSHREAAAQLGVPLGTVKTRIRTAVRSLRGTLAPEIDSIT